MSNRDKTFPKRYEKWLWIAAAVFTLVVFAVIAMTTPYYMTNMSASDDVWITSPTSSSDGKALVNINTASASELLQLPNMTTKLANNVVSYRGTYGRFDKPADILKVEGITEPIYLIIADYIVVE